MSGAIADLADSRYPFIDVVSVCSLWPCLMDDWNPLIAFMGPLIHALGQERGRERGCRRAAPSPAQTIRGAQGLLLQAGRAEEQSGHAQRGHGQSG